MKEIANKMYLVNLSLLKKMFRTLVIMRDFHEYRPKKN